MKDTLDMETPSKIWYVGHLFLWVITGLVCYVVWKDKNAEAARKRTRFGSAQRSINIWIDEPTCLIWT